jgi:hypothetical protein
MPADAVLEVGPTVNNFVPKNWRDATEKYGPQSTVEVLPNGHYVLHNYHGATPFPNPQEPNKGWKILANVFWSYYPAIYVNGPDSYGTVWANDRYGNVNATTLDVVYRLTSYITDPGFPATLNYAPGTWFTEWLMEESPEQARYTESLNLFFIDQEKVPFPDTYVVAPALRRSLRLANTARCAPIFGFDWTYDDGKTKGFNGSTSIYTGAWLGTAGKCTRIAVHGHRSVSSGSLRAAAEDFRELLNRNVLLPHLLPHHERRDPWMGELVRTEKRVGLSDVRCRVLEYPDDKASLINFDDLGAATVDKLGARAALEIDHSSDSRHAIEDLLKPFEDR